MQSRQVFSRIKGNKPEICFSGQEEVTPPAEIPKKMRSLLEEFKGVVHGELPEEISPMRDIQHPIKKASLTNLPHCRMNIKASKVLKEKVQLKLEKINAKYKATADRKDGRNSLRKKI